MKLLYTSDLHGSETHYERLLAVAESTRPDLVVLGGDLLPDDSALQPDRLGHGQPEYVRTRFRQIVGDLRRSSGCKGVLLIFGNHDWGSCVPAMGELASEGLVSILNPKEPLQIDGLSFLGYSCTPPTPWFVKDFERLDQPGDRPPLLGGALWDARFSRPVQHGAAHLYEIAPSIAEDLASVKEPAAPWVFVVHAPPHATHLDRAYGNHSYGSKAIREAIERLQPLLSLHGHIHESPKVSGHWRDALGETVSVNPGQETLTLNYVLVDIDVAEKNLSRIEHGQQS
ncbi:MAG: metallophosphoesterase [Phycisphaerae bacterium]